MDTASCMCNERIINAVTLQHKCCYTTSCDSRTCLLPYASMEACDLPVRGSEPALAYIQPTGLSIRSHKYNVIKAYGGVEVYIHYYWSQYSIRVSGQLQSPAALRSYQQDRATCVPQTGCRRCEGKFHLSGTEPRPSSSQPAPYTVSYTKTRSTCKLHFIGISAIGRGATSA
jgi:hypothetical protein